MDLEPSDAGGTTKTETILIFMDHAAADIAAAELRAYGIQCWINSDDGGGMLPNLTAPGGVRLVVQTRDKEEAVALLKGQTSGGDQPVRHAAAAHDFSAAASVPGKKFAPGQIFLGIVAGVLLCLFCQWATRPGTRTHFHYTQAGIPDEEWDYREGVLVEYKKDRNHDGAWDEWIYYEHGQHTRTEVDNNFDGKLDETWRYSNGTVVAMEKETDFNGTPDEFCTYHDGEIQQVDIRPHGAKFPSQRHLFKDGVLREILHGDGQGHFQDAVQYDSFFNPVSTNKY